MLKNAPTKECEGRGCAGKGSVAVMYEFEFPSDADNGLENEGESDGESEGERVGVWLHRPGVDCSP